MNGKEKLVMRDNHLELLDTINPTYLVSFLYSKRILDTEACL